MLIGGNDRPYGPCPECQGFSIYNDRLEHLVASCAVCQNPDLGDFDKGILLRTSYLSLEAPYYTIAQLKRAIAKGSKLAEVELLRRYADGV